MIFFVQPLWFLIQILSGEHWTPDQSRPAVFAGWYSFSSHLCDMICAHVAKVTAMLIYFVSSGSTKKHLSTLGMPSLSTPTIIRYVGTCANITLELSSVKREGHSQSDVTVWLSSCAISKVTSSLNLSLITVIIPRPSWLQAAWCKPMVTLMWPWTSTEWQRALFQRAPPSGTTLACASLEKRNMLLWVMLFDCHQGLEKLLKYKIHRSGICIVICTQSTEN